MLPEFSVFKNALSNEPYPQVATEQVIVERIRSIKYQPQTVALRATPEKAKASEYKKLNFVGVTWSGTFKPTRQKENLLKHSGLICLDIDNCTENQLAALFRQLMADPFTRVLFVSPSGNGLKAVLQTDCRSDKEHKAFFQQLADYYRDCYRVAVDPSGKDVSRLCFLPHDQNVYYNPDSDVMPLAPEYETQPAIEKAVLPLFKSVPTGNHPLNRCATIIRESPDGEKHHALVKAAYLAGGYVAGGLVGQNEAIAALEGAIMDKPNVADFKAAQRTIRTQIEEGKSKPITDFPSHHHHQSKEVSLETSTADWPNPLGIINQLRPVESLQPDMLPEGFRSWASDVAERMNCPLDFVGASAVVMMSSLIGTRLAIRPKAKDDWTVVPNLWGGVVAGPSMKKTPSMSAVLKPLRWLEDKAYQSHKGSLKSYEVEKIGCEAKKKAYQAQENKRAKGEPIEKEMDFPDEAIKPTIKRYSTNDTTIEKLTLLLDENPEGLLLFRDELTGLLSSWDKQGREEDRAFYLEAWNGYGSRTVDRMSRESVFVKPVCVSLLGGIQPGKLTRHLRAQEADENDGFLQRLQVLVYPDPRPPKYVDETADRAAAERAFALIEKVVASDFVTLGYLPSDQSLFVYTRFDVDAQAVFKDWLTSWEADVIAHETGLLQEHFAKYPSLMPSLALVLHVINVIDQPAPVDSATKQLVNQEAAMMAVRWCNYLASHARRIYGLLDTANTDAAQTLLQHIKARNLPERFKIRDVQQKGWRGLISRDDIEVALSVLAAHHWIRMEEGTNATGGRPQSPTYCAHPKISNSV